METPHTRGFFYVKNLSNGRQSGMFNSYVKKKVLNFNTKYLDIWIILFYFVVSKIRKDMTTIDKFIDDQRNFVLRVFKGKSELSPMLCMLTEKEGKTYTSMCPIPHELMTDKGKDIIRYGIVEKVKESIKKDGHKLLCVNWNSEGWMYQSSKEQLNEVDGYYRKLPRTEVLLMSFDTEEGSKIITYEIVRKMSVGVNGLNEEVEVELMKLGENFTTNGRFTNMF